MEKGIRIYTMYMLFIVLFLVVSVAGWGSMAPGELSVKPTVTINQAIGQSDPTNKAPIHFTVVFSKVVKDFRTGDVTLTGTAPGTLVGAVTGSDKIYDVAVTGMTGSGTVIANIASGAAHDAVGNDNKASTSTDNVVVYDITPPTVTINQAADQADPTKVKPIHFTVVFSEVVTDFNAGDVTITGTAPGTITKTVTGSGKTYDIAVTGMTGSGTVIADVAAGVAHDSAGNGNVVSTSTDNVVTYDITPPAVTINQAVGQVDPTNTAPIHFTVVFSEVVNDFTGSDVTITGTAPGTITRTVTGSGTTYDVAVSGMTGSGTVIANIAAGAAHDAVSNDSKASTSTDNMVTYDITPPTVTINQAAGQADPTNILPIHFTVVFSEDVADFNAGDVTITGTAPGTITKTVTGSGKTYDIAVTGLTSSGTVIANVAAGVAHDSVGNENTASTFTDNVVTYDISPPAVTINQAVGQADPTNTAPIHFTVVFSEVVTDFTGSDVTITGTAPGTITKTVTGSGTTYDVAVSGMTGSGTVIADLAAGIAHDSLGNASLASTSTDNMVTYDVIPPTVSINQAVGQADPTNTAPIHFTVVFSEAVTDFTGSDVTITGTAPGTISKTVTGSGTTYDVAVSGMTDSGTVIANIAAGVAHDLAGNASQASTSTDNTVVYDITKPTVTINQYIEQADPTNTMPIRFTVVFSKAVTDFTTGDVAFAGTAHGTFIGTVTGSGTTYDVAVTGLTGSGTVIANIIAGVAHDSVGNANKASTSTDNVVTYDITKPTVTINQAASQIDPTNTSPIHFTVVFSEVVADFDATDVTLSGTAPGTLTKVVTGSGTTYDVSVSGMTGSGTIIAKIIAGVAHDAVGNDNKASTSTDNTVTYDITPPSVTINQAVGQPDPTVVAPIRFTVVFSEAVTDFATGDVSLSGTAPGTLVGTVTGSGTTYTVAVTGMTGSGTVIANITAGVAHDAVGNASLVSTSIDNTVTYAVFEPVSIGFGAFGGGAGITNQGTDTIINGDIGTTAASTLITGFHDSTGDKYTETTLNVGNVTGRIYTDAPPPVIFGAGGPFGGTAATKAIADAGAADALTAFNYLKGLPTTLPDPSASGELSGLTLAPGVYKAAGGSYNIQSGGTLTLDALGDVNAIWVFQMDSSLTLGAIGGGATPAKVVFKNGVGQAKNVFWQVGSAATINTGATMVGTIIASSGVTLSTAGQTIITTLNGRAISLVASVTMVNTHINVP